MNYLKVSFIQNNCNVCSKTFCCRKCRIKHEECVHNYFEKCDICVYGKSNVSSIPEELIVHVEEYHWPLHCVYCKRLFASVKELISHNKCPIGPPESELSSKTPIRNKFIDDSMKDMETYKSPPVIYVPSTLTSTPMDRDQELTEFFGKNLTPLENCEVKLKINEDKSHFSLTPHIIENNKIEISVSNKRRVTFSDTFNTTENKKDNEDGLSSNLDNGEKGEDIFTTAKFDHSYFEQTDCNAVKAVGILKKRRSSTFSESTWDPALGETPLKIDNICDNVKISIFKSNCVENIFTASKFDHSYTEQNDNNAAKAVAILKKRRSSTFSESTWETALGETQFNIDNICDNVEISIFKSNCNTMDDSTGATQRRLPVAAKFRRSRGEIDNFSDVGEKSNDKPFWSNVASIVKNVVQHFKVSHKRQLSDSDYVPDDELLKLKRIKLTDIKCRPTMRNVNRDNSFIFKVDKATQTDFE